jgi:hemolysin activation/secretion protein
MSLGGAYGVRAYPQGEAPADKAAVGTLEARYNLALSLPGLWQLTTFVDGGKAAVNANPWTAANNKETLAGAGVGFNFAHAEGWAMKGSVAWRIRADRPTSDVDRTPRVWLQAAKDF